MECVSQLKLPTSSHEQQLSADQHEEQERVTSVAQSSLKPQLEAQKDGIDGATQESLKTVSTATVGSQAPFSTPKPSSTLYLWPRSPEMSHLNLATACSDAQT